MGQVFGPFWKTIFWTANKAASLTMAAHGGAAVYSHSFNLAYGTYFGVGLYMTAGTTVNLKFELEQSYKLPVTEAAADDYWTTVSGSSAIVDGANTKAQLLYSLSPAPFKYGRLKVSTKTGSTDDVVITAGISTQEEM